MSEQNYFQSKKAMEKLFQLRDRLNQKAKRVGKKNLTDRERELIDGVNKKIEDAEKVVQTNI